MSSRTARKKRAPPRQKDAEVAAITTPRGTGRKAVPKSRLAIEMDEEECEEGVGTSSPESSRAASPASEVKRGSRKASRTPGGRKRGSAAGSGTSTPVNNPRGSRASSVSSSTVKKSRK